MIGLVIVGHGTFASTMKRATEHLVNEQNYAIPIDIGPDDDMEARREEIREAVRTADQGNGVIVCTDMFGGTPSNLSISMLEDGKVEVIAGCNLPMLLKLSEVIKTSSLEDAAQIAKDAGQRYIAIASKILQVDNN